MFWYHRRMHTLSLRQAAAALVAAAGLLSTSAHAQEEGQGDAPSAEVTATAPAPKPSRGVRHELTLYPAAVQVNQNFTQHTGVAASYTVHLSDGIGLFVTPLFNWRNENERPVGPTLQMDSGQTLLEWGGLVGTELSPLRGTIGTGSMQADLSLGIFAGIGAGKSRHLLKWDNLAGPATYGDAGARFLASAGAGLRARLWDRLTLRLEVRDVGFSRATSTLNGCNENDLTEMDRVLRQGRTVDAARPVVSNGCRVETFEGTNQAGRNRSDDVPLALSVVKTPAAGVHHLVSVYAGAGFTF